MSDIELVELVIKIPEDVLKRTVFYREFRDLNDCVTTIKALENSIPIQKGHGRILDEKDILDTENNSGGWYDLTDMPEYIAGVKSIIEADMESEGE